MWLVRLHYSGHETVVLLMGCSDTNPSLYPDPNTNHKPIPNPNTKPNQP